MRFTQIPDDVADALAVNAGILLTDFTPATGVYDDADIVGATTGGVTATCVASYKDYGEDIDNCPKNTKELKRIDSWEVKMSGTLLSMKTAIAKLVLGAADIGATDTTKVTPRATLALDDFSDLWYVCDYSQYNGATNGGFVAVRLINALSTGGFSVKSTDKGKVQFAFEFTGHSSTASIDTVPMEFYIKAGTAEPAG